MTTLPIDKAVAYAKAMGGGGPAYSEVPQIQPINQDGEEVFLMVMDQWQEFNLRRNTTSMDWADLQKAMVEQQVRFEAIRAYYGVLVAHTKREVAEEAVTLSYRGGEGLGDIAISKELDSY